MVRSIVVPVDGSERSEAILPHVESLAQGFRATLILLMVIDPEPAVIAPEPMYTSLDPQYYEKRVREVEDYLIGLRKNLQKKGVHVKVRVSHGPVVEGIISVAEEENADLVAMSSHGRTGLSRVFYGSIAAGVLHRIDRPLLLIRSLDED